MPRAMRDEFFNMNNDNKAIFILSGFKCEYCPEWVYIYKAIAKFVYEMYCKRKQMYIDIFQEDFDPTVIDMD